MIEFLKLYYFEIAAVILALYLFIKAKRALRKIIGIIFTLATIARLILTFVQMN